MKWKKYGRNAFRDIKYRILVIAYGWRKWLLWKATSNATHIYTTMIASIVACGDSAKDWGKVPHDFSVGVNDALKWGYKVDHLLVCNRPTKFTSERMSFIKAHRGRFVTNSMLWKQFFPNLTQIKLRSWDGHLRSETVVSSQTSPICAMDYARQLGAKMLILWGVDFRNHHLFNDKNPATKNELRVYKGFIEALTTEGISVFAGREGSALGLQIYPTQ